MAPRPFLDTSVALRLHFGEVPEASLGPYGGPKGARAQAELAALHSVLHSAGDAILLGFQHQARCPAGSPSSTVELRFRSTPQAMQARQDWARDGEVVVHAAASPHSQAVRIPARNSPGRTDSRHATILVRGLPVSLARPGFASALVAAAGYAAGDVVVAHEFPGDTRQGTASQGDYGTLVALVVPPPADPALARLPADVHGIPGVRIHVRPPTSCLPLPPPPRPACPAQTSRPHPAPCPAPGHDRRPARSRQRANRRTNRSSPQGSSPQQPWRPPGVRPDLHIIMDALHARGPRDRRGLGHGGPTADSPRPALRVLGPSVSPAPSLSPLASMDLDAGMAGPQPLGEGASLPRLPRPTEETALEECCMHWLEDEAGATPLHARRAAVQRLHADCPELCAAFQHASPGCPPPSHAIRNALRRAIRHWVGDEHVGADEDPDADKALLAGVAPGNSPAQRGGVGLPDTDMPDRPAARPRQSIRPGLRVPCGVYKVTQLPRQSLRLAGVPGPPLPRIHPSPAARRGGRC